MSGLLKTMNMEFACDQCEYEAKTKGMLKIHHISLHQDLKYFCNPCGYQTSRKGNLTTHQQSVHEEKKYECK